MIDVDNLTPEQMSDMECSIESASNFLKAISHEGRLMILCYLVLRERSVTELERELGWRQASVSQQLARLRMEGIVKTRREGKAIYYSIAEDHTQKILDVVHDVFCKI